MSWLFSTRRDPEDPFQLQIAAHELGHAVAWQAGGRPWQPTTSEETTS